MFRIIRAAFNQRRKTLVNAVCSNFGNITKEQMEKTLEKCGFDTKIRGEALDIVGFAKIADEMDDIKASDL